MRSILQLSSMVTPLPARSFLASRIRGSVQLRTSIAASAIETLTNRHTTTSTDLGRIANNINDAIHPGLTEVDPRKFLNTASGVSAGRLPALLPTLANCALF